MVRDSDEDTTLDDVRSAASMLQSKQLISTNVVTKRKEQLTRWEKSEMNGEPPHRTRKAKVHFQDGDIFLSACMAGDEGEVVELLAKGADINTATVDGLTALHQSVIDSKPEMVRFLCMHGADVNAQDNEGWTPLHAAACCGNVAIVRLLCEAGAHLTTINSDKELAVDLAENDECRAYLEHEYDARGIDLDGAREQELSTMLSDVQTWTKEGVVNDRPHPRTGATALHVAAAKGYTQVVEMLLRAGVEIHVQDLDGWTPLHAAAHWGEKDACKMLMDAGATLDVPNFVGQSVLAVADKDIVDFLEMEKAAADAMKERARKDSSVSSTVLSEKNGRAVGSPVAVTSSSSLSTTSVSSGAGATVPPAVAAHHAPPTVVAAAAAHPHLLSTEQKHALAVSDERSENEKLHPSKVPRMESAIDERSSLRSEEETTTTSRASPMDTQPSAMTSSTTRSVSSRSSSDRELSTSSTASSSITPSERSMTPAERMPPPSRPTAMDSSSTVSSTSSVSTTPLATPSTPTGAPGGPSTESSSSSSTTVQFTVPLRSWTRPPPLATSSSSTSSRSSTASIGAAPSASTSAPAVSSPLTVKPPASLSPIRENLAAPPASMAAGALTPRTAASSAPSPTTLPWQALLTSASPSAGHRASSIVVPSRTSAFRPLASGVAPATPVTPPVRRPAPGPLPAHVMRPWQSATVASQESESERRQTARMQRAHRRSTQGVTKEQLEEASRLAAEESARRRASQASASSGGSGPCRLASEEKDSSLERSVSYSAPAPPTTPLAPPRISAEVRLAASADHRNSSERYSDSSRASPASSVPTSRENSVGAAVTPGTLSLPSAIPTSASQTPSAANVRRKSSQVLSGLSRSARRGTGPVLAEDIAAASSVAVASAPTPTAPAAQPTPPWTYNTSSSSSMTSARSRTTNADAVAPTTNTTTATVPPFQTSASVRQPTAGGASTTTIGGATSVSRVAPRVTTAGSSQFAAPTISSTAAANANYRVLYEKERAECEKLRRELEEARRGGVNGASENGSSTLASTGVSSSRRVTSARMASNASAASGLSRSPSGASMEDAERRTLERRITELELEVKSLGQLRMENQRLKEENGALVRVISKMTI